MPCCAGYVGLQSTTLIFNDLLFRPLSCYQQQQILYRGHGLVKVKRVSSCLALSPNSLYQGVTQHNFNLPSMAIYYLNCPQLAQSSGHSLVAGKARVDLICRLWVQVSPRSIDIFLCLTWPLIKFLFHGVLCSTTLYVTLVYTLVTVTHHLNSRQASCLSWQNNDRRKRDAWCVGSVSCFSSAEKKMGKMDENNAKLKQANHFLRNIISRDSKNTGDNCNYFKQYLLE